MILGKLYFFQKKILEKNLNSQTHQLTLTLFYCLINEIRLGDSAIPHTRENSKMFNITSNYFSNFNTMPPASWAVHMKRNFLTC